MTDKPKALNLTTQHFERARADVSRRRKEMNAKLDLELADIAALETTSADFAERYPEDAAAPPSDTRAPAQTTRRKARRSNAGRVGRSNAGRPYYREEDVRIQAAARGQLEQLAKDLGRPYEGVMKRHEVLLKRRKPGKTDMPAEDRALTAAPEAPLGDDPEMEKREEPINWREAYPQPAPPEKPVSENSKDEAKAVGGSIERPADTVCLTPSQQGIMHRALQRSTKPVPEQPVAPPRPVMTDGERRLARTPAPKPGIVVSGRLIDNGPEDRRIYPEDRRFYPEDFTSPRSGG